MNAVSAFLRRQEGFSSSHSTAHHASVFDALWWTSPCCIHVRDLPRHTDIF